ncbi:MAG TPA: right-handed parallel beta-helix repeat-containing protein, partial [Firmicutes bacterium]|nr:right-handed parallel beta-helix repeat-containing protein [Bacillota bacterium]
MTKYTRLMPTDTNERPFTMKRRSVYAVALFAALGIGIGCASTGGRTMQTVTEYHVSPTGDDRCSGERDMPFRTLAHARDMIRHARTAGIPSPNGVTVWLHDGRHELDETFVLGPEDSGTPNAPIIYRALPGANVTISGGREIGGWTDYAGDDAAVTGIKQTSIAHLGFGESDMVGTEHVFPFELFYRGERMDQARWPNRDPEDIYSGWAHIASVPEPEQRLQFGVRVDAEQLRGWATAEHAQFHMYARYDWSDVYVGLGRVDVEAAQIHLADPTNYTIATGRRYMIRNVFSELDIPGEWYVNARDGVVSFLPPDGLEDGDVIVSRVDELVHIDGASHIVFRDLRFEHARDAAVVVTSGDGNTIAASTIQNVGGYAVRIDGGTNNRVIGCDITKTGTGGFV